uniref:NADH-ubiquinone oxidoreductase chain 2 n=1 Tax=Kilauella sp. KispEL TaxID=1940902 RepID=A0A8K1ZFR0_9NEOP|nr:NADH dehydrogenase subunit 2 [Kilauella sp. KispEL]
MLNNLNILFILMMIISSLISISATNWFGAWMGLELNMLSFVPLMVENKNILSNESALKYFLIQAVASSMFIMFSVFNSFFYFLFFNFTFFALQNFLLMIPLFIKLGAAPFHTWFIMIMEGMKWPLCFLLMTWQKIAPLFIISYIYVNNNLLMFFSISSLVVGSIGGLSQTSFRKLLAFSSVNHIGWLISSLMLNKILLLMYFLFYFFMNLFVFFNLNLNSTFQFNQSFMKPQLFSLAISFLSLGGLPPFLGFLPKWMILQNWIAEKSFFLCFVLVMTALITLYYYLRITYSIFINLSLSSKWIFRPNVNLLTLNTIFLIISSTGLFLFNLILT